MDSENIDFEIVEDEIITAIKSGMSYVKTVKTYSGDLEESEIRKMINSFPAIFVIYRGGAMDIIDGPNHNSKETFAILVASKSLRGEESARKDRDKGCYRMMKDVLTTLTNKTFGLDIERMTPVRKYLVFTSGSFAVYGIDFRTNFDTTYNV